MILNQIKFCDILKSKIPIVAFLCPNYEERSTHFAQLYSNCLQSKKDFKLFTEIIYLQNESENSALLDGFKSEAYEKLRHTFTITNDCFHHINFPDNFSAVALSSIVKTRLEQYFMSENKLSIIIDISAMPRSIVLEFCNIINCIRNDVAFKEHICKIYFLYVPPEKYSDVSFSQDVGTLYGYFSGEPLYKNTRPIVHSIIFPGRQGYESNLVLDNLSSESIEHHADIFFSIDKKDYLESMRLMRANINILNSKTCTEEYYCSLSDGIRSLSSRLIQESIALQKNDSQESRLYLIAPFNSKIMLPAAFFLLTKMKRIFPKVKIDISIMKNFQYTSTYSLGTGEAVVYELNQEEYDEDIFVQYN